MNLITVTRIENIAQKEDSKKLDDKGIPLLHEANFELDDDDIPVLVDPDDVGMLVKTHTIQVSHPNPSTGVLEIGVVIKVEVIWNKRRNPCPAFEAPEDLVFLTIDDSDVDTDSDESEFEEEEGLDDQD